MAGINMKGKRKIIAIAMIAIFVGMVFIPSTTSLKIESLKPQDKGETATVTIHAFLDENKNGQQDPGEADAVDYFVWSKYESSHLGIHHIGKTDNEGKLNFITYKSIYFVVWVRQYWDYDCRPQYMGNKGGWKKPIENYDDVLEISLKLKEKESISKETGPFRPLLKLSGRVINCNGEPLDEVQLEFKTKADLIPRTLYSRTNENGYYERHLTNDFTFGCYYDTEIIITCTKYDYQTKRTRFYIGHWSDGDELEAPTIIMTPGESDESLSTNPIPEAKTKTITNGDTTTYEFTAWVYLPESVCTPTDQATVTAFSHDSILIYEFDISWDSGFPVYYKYLPAGVYDIVATAEGYKQNWIKNIPVGENCLNSVTFDSFEKAKPKAVITDPAENLPRPPTPIPMCSGHIVGVGYSDWYGISVAGDKTYGSGQYKNYEWKYKFGDDSVTNWFNLDVIGYPKAYHKWRTAGVYDVRVKARTKDGSSESPWSLPWMQIVIEGESVVPETFNIPIFNQNLNLKSIFIRVLSQISLINNL
jgi:hypothetical protein